MVALAAAHPAGALAGPGRGGGAGRDGRSALAMLGRAAAGGLRAMSTAGDRAVDGAAAEEGLTDAAVGARLKVCGITEPGEIDLLGTQGVDFVGLWHGVPGGPAELPLGDWRMLAAAAGATPGLHPVLVTFLKDVEAMREALAGSGVVWVQLHGYQTPGLVRAVKRIAPEEIRVIKVLHVRGGDCVEGSLIASYEKAGVDVFLLDAVSEDGRVGSTGQSLDPEVAWRLAERMTRPFLLAGGISAANRSDYDTLAGHPRFLGIDVDTNARGADGLLEAEKVAAISLAWKGA